MPAAVAWLSKVFGFRPRLTIETHRVQMTCDTGAMVAAEGGPADAMPGRAHSMLARVESVDAHCATARQHGATIVREPATHPYGERQYTGPAAWGGVLHT